MFTEILHNDDVLSAIGISLISSFSALCIASLFAVPLAVYLASRTTLFTRCLRFVIDTLQALPTVLIGLIGYILFSKQGIFHFLHILYTVEAISIMLACLAFPILTALLTHVLESAEITVRHTAMTLGATPLQVIRTVLWEVRRGVIVAYVTVFSRTISEIGIAMMVGGNIRYHTRTITTTIALETGKGNFEVALTLGIILLCIAVLLNGIIRLCSIRPTE